LSERPCASSAWKASWANGAVRATNPASDLAPWIKLRANLEQEFVIGGYIPGARGFDALLVGVYKTKKLVFVAKVKNGFVPRVRGELFPAPQGAANCPVPHAAA
jgi:hypothetical protein